MDLVPAGGTLHLAPNHMWWWCMPAQVAERGSFHTFPKDTVVKTASNKRPSTSLVEIGPVLAASSLMALLTIPSARKVETPNQITIASSRFPKPDQRMAFSTRTWFRPHRAVHL